MKKLIAAALFLFPLLTWAHSQDIYADDEIRGEELIELVREEGRAIESSTGTTEVYEATVQCHKDKINSKLSYCTIKN